MEHDAAPRLGGPGVQRGLQVDVLERRQPARPDRALEAGLAEVGLHERYDRVLAPAVLGLWQPVEEAWKAAAKARASSADAGIADLLGLARAGRSGAGAGGEGKQVPGCYRR